MSFIDHAAAHGLVIEDLIADGRWHRTRTADKPKKRNGCYLFDGARGVVMNWATMAKAVSWREGGKVEQVDRAAIRRMQAQAKREEQQRHESARATAESMIERASVTSHPYLAAKGFPLETGLVLDGELLVPMREFALYRQVNSIQTISADGKKLFLQGGKAKGSVYFIGAMVPRERWLCEGYATGLSIRAALRALYRDSAQVIVCFSVGNLAHVGRIVSTLRGKSYVIADNDESGAGAKAAAETGLPWGMPPTVGHDANDMHQRAGVLALKELIRDITGGSSAFS